jgi:predicted acetyltransferase
MSRDYTADDLGAAQRIWKECGWVESDEEAQALESFLAEATARVAELDGEVECLACSHHGSLRYDRTDLDALLVTAVTTSWVGRKQGLATRLTAEVVAAGARAGAAVAALGIFEHGFYNALGFGSGPYEHVVRFDPSSIRIDAPYRPPVRLGVDNYAEIAAALRRRKRSHGGLTIDGSEFMKAELTWVSPPIGLGYRDDTGRLTHFVWGKTKGDQGPYRLNIVSYETSDQLLELLAMLRALGDQVRTISMPEPPELLLQDLVQHPFRAQTVTKGSDFESGIRSNAWWQMRILDVPTCIARCSWQGSPVRFNLELTDPIEGMVPDFWNGVGGSYVVEIGEASSATTGTEPGLPTLSAGVGAFTRLWLGAHSASSLALTAEMDGPPELLEQLDDAFRLPTPRPGIYF